MKKSKLMKIFFLGCNPFLFVDDGNAVGGEAFGADDKSAGVAVVVE